MIEPPALWVQLIVNEIDATDGSDAYAEVGRGLGFALDLIAADVRTVLDQRHLHAHRERGLWDRGSTCTECAARDRLARIFTDQAGRP